MVFIAILSPIRPKGYHVLKKHDQIMCHTKDRGEYNMTEKILIFGKNT